MRHTRLFTVILFLLAALTLSGSAFADSMSFIGPSGNNSGGVYTYPYSFSINGGPATPLLCDAFDNSISPPETWTANENSIPGGTGLFGSTSSANYAAAGLIFDAILNVNGGALNGTVSNSDDANWAIWAIFSSNALADINPGNASSPFGNTGDSNALSIYNAALGAAGSATPSNFSGIVIYTPVPGSQSGRHGTPQEFLGYSIPDGSTPVPEPSEVSLLGILALCGLTGFAFRKQLAPKFAIGIQQ
jgi:hypothetical protein